MLRAFYPAPLDAQHPFWVLDKGLQEFAFGGASLFLL